MSATITDDSTDTIAPERCEYPPREKLHSLQILRGLAASLVVIHHISLAQVTYGGGSSWIERSGLGALGASGVDLFFVISGFIMMYTSDSERGVYAAKAFFIRRARRIFPLYWTWTTLILLLWKTKLLFTHTHYRPLYIVSSYLLWPIQNGNTFHPVLDPGWTLTLEIFFYLVFGMMIAFSSGISLGVLVLSGLVVGNLLGNLLGHLSPAISSLHYLLANNLMVEFAFGIVAAYLLKAIVELRLPARSRKWIIGGLITSGVTALLLSVNFGVPEQWRFLVWGLPCFCILLGTVQVQLQSPYSLLIHLGDASYSIYLGHFLLVVAYATVIKNHHLPGWLSADASILLAAAAIVAISSLGCRFIEKPELRWLDRSKTLHAQRLRTTRSVVGH